ncbi:hypothetical protein QLQ22_09125 [Metabacillus sp. CT-WN-B3]|uniref:Uncharacterized protein n=1 Tax=Metabacillus hrfriensis TaxID=3048891 RepID=A0ACD4RGM3_9BACI|nr:hypothetical protein [Metabacillus sp. CT-WN-B3]WHZ59468.1 hypothetical protein QLQ22_09125 [Metabacillus sp. CT-WN-B3]
MPIKPILVKLKSNFRITPAIYAVIFFFLAVLSMITDRYLAENDYFKHIPSAFFTDKELSHTILSATSTSLLTMTARLRLEESHLGKMTLRQQLHVLNIWPKFRKKSFSFSLSSQKKESDQNCSA